MKTKKQYEVAFRVVRHTIAKADPYSLLETGSPEDEFDAEVNSIVRQLPRCQSATDVAHTIARVMTSSFGEKYKSEDFMEQGQEIYRTLKATRNCSVKYDIAITSEADGLPFRCAPR